MLDPQQAGNLCAPRSLGVVQGSQGLTGELPGGSQGGASHRGYGVQGGVAFIDSRRDASQKNQPLVFSNTKQRHQNTRLRQSRVIDGAAWG